ncbi:MAG: TorF family putative porin [Verrucomicrobiales bacterium]
MKISNSIAILASAMVFATSSANAGEMVEMMEVEEFDPGMSSLIDPVTGSVSVGYDSHYIFRGTNLGENAPWLGVDLSTPLGNGLTLDAGLWYVNSTSGSDILPNTGANDELDLYVSLGGTVGPVDIAVGYTAYLFPESRPDSSFRGNSENEVGISFGTAISIIDASFAYYYNWDSPIDNNYYELGLSTGIDLSDRTSLAFGVDVAFYGSNYSHTLVTASMPIVITQNAVIEPYIAYVWADSIQGIPREDQLFGGVSLNVSF